MDIQLTQQKLRERQHIDAIRKIFALMSRHNITLEELNTFEDEFASLTPKEMIAAAKRSERVRLPKVAPSTKIEKANWSL